MKMKVFISQAMNGVPEEEIMELREKATKYLEKRFSEFEIEVIDSYHHKDVPNNAGRLWYLGTSIRMMGEADIVVFLYNWVSAKGCRIEHNVCKSYGIPHMFLDYSDI